MDTHHSVIDALANGVDPNTGEVLPDNSPYNSPVVIRALFKALEAMKQEKPARPRIKKTVEEKQTDNLEKGLPKNAGLPWSDAQKQELADKFNADVSVAALAEIFCRTEGAIRSELKKQGLIED